MTRDPRYNPPMHERALFELELHGFTVLEGVLSPAEAEELRAVNERVFAEFGELHRFQGEAGHLSNIITRDRAYLPLIDHPRVLPIFEAAMGPDLILGSLNSRVLRPGDGPQHLHTDVPLVLRRTGRPLMMNSIWMLDDFTLENGATRIVPGSHLSPMEPVGQRFHGDPEPPPIKHHPRFVHHADGKAGSVVVFDGRCWHGGGKNTTNRRRHGLFGHYRVAPWMRFQADPHDGFPPEWFDTLNERQRQLLRMQKGLGHKHGSDYDERPPPKRL